MDLRAGNPSDPIAFSCVADAANPLSKATVLELARLADGTRKEVQRFKLSA
jgi:hypothetical protein